MVLIRGQVDNREDVRDRTPKQIIVTRVMGDSLRRTASLVNQSRGEEDWFSLEGNIPKGSIDKDKHQECIGQRKAKKYLRESCYYCIECFVANSLTALIWK